MNGFFQSVGIFLLGFALLTLQSAIAAVVQLHPFAPNLMLPIVIFLGVSPEVGTLRGVVISFLLGYLLDLFCGNLMSLQTFVLVATFLLARGAGLRLFLRGPAFQVLLTFVVCVLSGAAIFALRAIFEQPAPFEAGTPWDTVWVLVAPAIVTAVCAPLVFVAVRRIESFAARRREEASA